MTTAIIGTGNIGGTLARHLVRGGEPVVLAAKDEANAAALAQELGAAGARRLRRRRYRRVRHRRLRRLARHDEGTDRKGRAPARRTKSSSIPRTRSDSTSSGEMMRTLPEEQSAGSVVAALLPAGAHYVKAFGTLGSQRARERGKPRTAAGRALLRHRRRRGCDDDRTADPCRRLRPVENGRSRLRRPARGAGRRPPPGRAEWCSSSIPRRGARRRLSRQRCRCERNRHILAGLRAPTSIRL